MPVTLTTGIVREGRYVAEVEVALIETDGGWRNDGDRHQFIGSRGDLTVRMKMVAVPIRSHNPASAAFSVALGRIAAEAFLSSGR